LHKARIATAIIFFINGAVLGGLAPNYPSLKERLHLSGEQFGLCLMCGSVGGFLALLLAGGLVDRHGSRRITLISGVLLCLLLPWTVTAQTTWMFCGLFFLTWFCNGMLDPAMNSHAVIVQREFVKPILSVIHGCWSIGGFAGGMLVALALRLHISPLAEALLMDTVLLAALILAVRHMLPTIEQSHEGPPIRFPTGILLILGILVGLAFVSEAAGTDWTPLYLRNALKTGADTAALAFGAYAGGMALMRFAGDAVIHRIGNRNTLLFGGIISALGFVLAIMIQSTAVALAGFAIAGAGMSNVIPILFRAAGSVPGVGTGMGIAGASTCGYIAALLGGPTIGYLSDRVSIGFAVAMIGSLIVIPGVFGARMLHRTTVPP